MPFQAVARPPNLFPWGWDTSSSFSWVPASSWSGNLLGESYVVLGLFQRTVSLKADGPSGLRGLCLRDSASVIRTSCLFPAPRPQPCPLPFVCGSSCSLTIRHRPPCCHSRCPGLDAVVGEPEG